MSYGGTILIPRSPHGEVLNSYSHLILDEVKAFLTSSRETVYGIAWNIFCKSCLKVA
jgi:hypothetical protein